MEILNIKCLMYQMFSGEIIYFSLSPLILCRPMVLLHVMQVSITTKQVGIMDIWHFDAMNLLHTRGSILMAEKTVLAQTGALRRVLAEVLGGVPEIFVLFSRPAFFNATDGA